MSYKNISLRSLAKRIPFLVRIVHKIRVHNPSMEFLVPKWDRKKAKNINYRVHKQEELFDCSGNKEISSVRKKYFDEICELAKTIPQSNGSRYYKKANLKIGIICDLFFYDSFKAVADFVYLTPDNWKENCKDIDLLFVISTWNGLNKEWSFSSNSDLTYKKSIIFEIIAFCKEKGVKTVYYSKEDPPDYKLFLPYAKVCDYIFTSDINCIDMYKQDTGNDKVYPLCFSVNPLFHNPVGFRKYKKDNSIVFAGSWMHKFFDRCKDLARLFDGVIQFEYNLIIIDRYYPWNNYCFPDMYQDYIYPSIGHDLLQKIHKLYNWSICVNSIKQSQTMFANRNFELLASGVLMISNYSLGVNTMLPNIFMPIRTSEIKNILHNYTEDEIYEMQVFGIRTVMTGHTCFDRMDYILKKIDFNTHSFDLLKKVLVVGDESNKSVMNSYKRQTYKDKEFANLSDVLTMDLSSYSMIAFFGKDMYYGEFYLQDMINGFKYTNSDYITKDAFFDNGVLQTGIEHDYVNVLRSKYRTVFWRESFNMEEIISLKDDVSLPNGYSIDRFNYDAKDVIKKVDKKENYKISIVIPVYNNGLSLYGKSFNSLRRSSIFSDMDIILVDDGSTDENTIAMINYLCSCYPKNVQSFFFEKGGSGSASRPRNKGIELAKAEYISFLDPDDESIDDGFANMLSNGDGCSLVISTHLEVGKDIMRYSCCKKFMKELKTDSIKQRINQLSSILGFPTIRLQGSCVIKKSLFLENHIKYVEGAIGEDTLCGWQVLDAADSIKVLSSETSLYYASVEGSISNVISASYFAKLYKLQEYKLKWLLESGNADVFFEGKYNSYTETMLLQKFVNVLDNEAEKALEYVKEYLDLYLPYYNGSSDMINEVTKIINEKDAKKVIECINSFSAA